jgi:hypothetical protein
MKKRQPIIYKKERAVLSDVLPYELPITFSNRHFYNFLVNNKIELVKTIDKKDESNNIYWKFLNKHQEKVIRLLFDIHPKQPISYLFSFKSKKQFKNALIKLIIELAKNYLELDVRNNKISVIGGKKKIDKNLAKFKKFLENNDLQLEFLSTPDDKYVFGIPDNIESFLYRLGTCLSKNITINVHNDTVISTNKVVNDFLIKNYQAFCSVKVDKINGNDSSIKGGLRKAPFNFKVSHKNTEFRELSLIHPFNQLTLVEFYNRYKEQILYYSRQSKFSIRRPEAVAKFVYYNDLLHRQNKGDEKDGIEISDNEYESLKHFFTYKKYSNIHKFYEDYTYHRCEKKYKNLFKFDISKCFDSIYSHTIAWALLDKDFVKDNINASTKTFAGQFDKFIQNCNYGETNGIVIGPEFSRIFAELILQQIDKNVERRLREDEGIFLRLDYELYRYVDDSFLFYNDEKIKEKVVEFYSLELKEYKMHINDAKSIDMCKPMITDLTIAKMKVSDLFNSELKYKIKETEEEKVNQDGVDELEDNQVKKVKYSIYVSSNKLITRFKSIIKETNIEYKDIVNYALAAINRRVEAVFKDYESIFKSSEKETNAVKITSDDHEKYNKKLTEALLQLLDFTFFIYSVTPRVNSTIKLVKILIFIINKLKRAKYKFGNNKDLVFKKIQDEVVLVMEQNSLKEFTQLETLYLLIVLRELGKAYYLKSSQLEKYFHLNENRKNKSNKKSELPKLNYFSINVLLSYVKNIKQYDAIREKVKKCIVRKISEVEEDKRTKDTECVMLLFDLLSCPFLVESNEIKYDYKKELLTLFSIPEEEQVALLKYISKQGSWFTKWRNFDLEKEINAKISQEVYS